MINATSILREVAGIHYQTRLILGAIVVAMLVVVLRSSMQKYRAIGLKLGYYEQGFRVSDVLKTLIQPVLASLKTMSIGKTWVATALCYIIIHLILLILFIVHLVMLLILLSYPYTPGALYGVLSKLEAYTWVIRLYGSFFLALILFIFVANRVRIMMRFKGLIRDGRAAANLLFTIHILLLVATGATAEYTGSRSVLETHVALGYLALLLLPLNPYRHWIVEPLVYTITHVVPRRRSLRVSY